MKTVWKFPLHIAGTQYVSMPAHSRALHAGLDPNGQPCVWATVLTNMAPVEHTVYISGTGHPVPDGDNRHIGSFNHGPFEWHVWVPC